MEMQQPITTNMARQMIMDSLNTSKDPGLYYVQRLFVHDPIHESGRSETKYWIPRKNYQQLINTIAEKEKPKEVIAPPYT